MAYPIDYGKAIDAGVQGYFRGRGMAEEERRRQWEEQRQRELDARAEEAAAYERSLRPIREGVLRDQADQVGMQTEGMRRSRNLETGMTQAWQDAQVPDISRTEAYPDETGGFAPVEPEYAQGLKQHPRVTNVPRFNRGREQSLAQNAPMQLDQARAKFAEAEREGVVEAMQLLAAGQPQEAAQVFNQYGEKMTKGFRPHPSKRGVWIGMDEQGQEGEIDPKLFLKAYGKYKEQEPIELNYGSKLVTPSGQEIANNPRSDESSGGGGEGMSVSGLKATEAYRKYREIKALRPDMPDDLAFAKAYDFIEKTTDPMGFGSAYTDIASGNDIGSIGLQDKAYTPNREYGARKAMVQLPPPQHAKGRTMADDSGRVFRSDGQWWYDQEGNPVDAAGNPIQQRRGMTAPPPPMPLPPGTR